MTLTIYKFDPSPPARAAMMLIELLQLDVKTIEEYVLNPEHPRPEFKVLNPIHTVPFLIDGDFSLSDSHAILTYLVNAYGGEKHANLYPKDIKTKATVDSRLYFDTSLFFPKIQRVGQTVFYLKATKPSEQHVADMTEIYDFLEKYLEKTSYIAADHLTVADIACVATLSASHTLVPVEDKYVRIHAWWNKLKAEEWYKANLKGTGDLKAIIDGHIEKNKKSA